MNWDNTLYHEHLCEQDDGHCRRPPQGWHCTREAGHAGPCAARRDVQMATYELRDSPYRRHLKQEARHLDCCVHESLTYGETPVEHQCSCGLMELADGVLIQTGRWEP